MEVPSSTIWRNNSTGKVAPHNAYASDKSLREYGQSLKYTLESQPELKLFEFTSEFTDVHGNAATAITIAFNNDNVSQFNYDTATKTYKYTKDGYHQIDEHTQTDIAPTNVIVHTMDFKPINSEKGTYTLQQTGEGTAHYFTGGQQVSIKWKKIEGLPYQYFTEDDKPLKLNPGMTWIAFGKPDTQISYQ